MRLTVARPKRRSKKAATDSSATSAVGTSGSSARRARAPQVSRLYPASAARPVGMPSTEGEGRGCSLPRFSTKAVRGGVLPINRDPRPISSHNRIAEGFSARRESGPASSVNPSTCSVRIRPPGLCDFSSSRNGTSRRASSNAAARPVMPPPMMRINSPMSGARTVQAPGRVRAVCPAAPHARG